MKKQFENAYLFDSITTEWLSLQSITIENGIFSEVDIKEKKLPDKQNNKFSFVLPGLIDSHVHITEEPRFDKLCNFSLNEPIEFAALRAKKNLLDAAIAGITTVKDLGSYKTKSLDVRDWLIQHDELFDLPRLLTSGCMITKRRGHAVDRGVCAENYNELEKIIANLKERKINALKVINDPPVFSVSELNFIKRISDSLQLPLSVHIFSDKAAKIALDAGVKLIEHIGKFSKNTINKLSSNQVCVVPTFIAAFDTVTNPKETLAESLFEDANLDIFSQWYKDTCEILPKLWREGIVLACGTDSGFPGTKCNSLIREILSWNILGIPVYFALQAATRGGAIACGLEDSIGRVAKGYSADYVVYTSNPIINPKVLFCPSEVWCRGKRLV